MQCKRLRAFGAVWSRFWSRSFGAVFGAVLVSLRRRRFHPSTLLHRRLSRAGATRAGAHARAAPERGPWQAEAPELTERGRAAAVGAARAVVDAAGGVAALAAPREGKGPDRAHERLKLRRSKSVHLPPWIDARLVKSFVLDDVPCPRQHRLIEQSIAHHSVARCGGQRRHASGLVKGRAAHVAVARRVHRVARFLRIGRHGGGLEEPKLVAIVEANEKRESSRVRGLRVVVKRPVHPEVAAYRTLALTSRSASEDQPQLLA